MRITSKPWLWIALSFLVLTQQTGGALAKKMAEQAGPLRKIYVIEPHAFVAEPEPPSDTRTSNNFGEREYGPIDTIVIHATASPSSKSVVNWFLNPESGVSSHILIPDPGKPGEPEKTIRFVPDWAKAWHVRREATFQGRNDLNSRSLGIEIQNTCNKDDPYSEWQIEETARWCRYWIQKLPIKYIVTHAWVDPMRRKDPCDTFPWESFLKKVEKGVIVDKRPIVVFVNGKKLEMDASFSDGTSYGELRPIVEALGGKIAWDGATKTVKITK